MFSSFTILDVLIFITGAMWLLKKIAEMDRYDDLRVIVLTVILSCVALYGFKYVWLQAGNAEYFEPDCRVEQRFCYEEM
jgi:hypothetical protein